MLGGKKHGRAAVPPRGHGGITVWIAVPLAVLSLGFVSGACGGDSSAPATTPADTAETPPPEPTTLELEKLSKRTTDESIDVRGTVTKDARVTVNGKRAKVKGERFSASVPLDIGKNGIRLAAVAPSFARVQERAEVRREEASVEAVDETATGSEASAPEGEAPASSCSQTGLNSQGEGTNVDDSCVYPGCFDDGVCYGYQDSAHESMVSPSECVPGYHYTNEPPGGCVPD